MTVIAVNRNHTYGVTVNLVVWECSCGIVYGIPQDFADNLRKHGGHYYCPNGHRLSWDGNTDLDKERAKAQRLERQLASSQDTASRWRENAERQRRSAIAFKGHVTRIRNRITNGVCPVPGCKRSGFKQVMSHIASQHPDWLHDHAHELERGESVWT